MIVAHRDEVMLERAMAGCRPARRRRHRCGLLIPGLLAALAACAAEAPQAPAATADLPPSIAAVRDGIGDDVDSQSASSSLFANWDEFVDPEGRPVVYEWCIGTAPGSGDVQAWMRVGGATHAATEGLVLPNGRQLFVSVRAFDLAGNQSAPATSDGIRIGAAVATDAPEVPPSTPTPPAPTPPAPPTPAPLPPAPPVDHAGHVTDVERHGITWTFAHPVAAGRFANGDWWVVGPVEIVQITPACTDSGGRVRNGSMVDPDPRNPRQGYDSAMFGPDAGDRYEPARNVALGIGPARPLALRAGSSLVSTISHPEAGQMPQLDGCSILTCLAKAPPVDAFRPPYCGSQKEPRWTTHDLDPTRLARVEAVPGAPDLRTLALRFERPWLDHLEGWTSRYLHPRDNMPDYGRDLADLVGQGALALQLDVPDAEKSPLLVNMVQLGIDLHGIVANGGRFAADGGSGGGRKFPVLLAGTLLQDDEMLRTARERKFAFAEDAQTFFVEETSPGIWNHGHGGYGPDDVGLAEWGNQHANDPSRDRKPWTADPYRRCCTVNGWLGFVLAARIMGLREAWGHEPLFAYVDRYLQIEPQGTWTRSWSPFNERMWDRHRPAF
jgi:hypothetical protein